MNHLNKIMSSAMSLTKFERIKKSFSLFSNWLLYIVILYLFIEIAAGLALDSYKKNQRGATDYSILDSEAISELTEVQQNVKLNLYRWYSNKANFKGKHVVTDASGFRINKETLTNDEIVGMFGGSTTFSVLTSQENTIPNLLSNLISGRQVLNFGVGGYSTGAEIMTFVEALRAYPKMKSAIFYDGVNELGRPLERVGGMYNNSYELIGSPYVTGEINAISRSIPGISIADSNIYYIYKRILPILNKNEDPSKKDERLISIKHRYFENVRVLSGICSEYEVECIFVWQPSIFTTSKNSLTVRENQILNETPMKEYTELTAMIFQDKRSKHFNIINLSNALNKKPPTEQYFYDWCHLSREGNKLIANEIANILVNK